MFPVTLTCHLTEISDLGFQVRTFKGHTNEKNFVGLTVNNEFLACGSETNEVFAYHKVKRLVYEASSLSLSLSPQSVRFNMTILYIGKI